MYIYHNKELDEYRCFSNLSKLCREKGVDYNEVSNIFSRRKLLRYDGDDFVIVRDKQ